MCRIFLFFLIYFSLVGFTSLQSPEPLATTPQDALSYLPTQKSDQPLLSSIRADQLYHDYLRHYFAPWHDDKLYSPSTVRQTEYQHIAALRKTPGWGENQCQHTLDWVNQLAQTMDMANYPNCNQLAITVTVTHTRELPTVEPVFKNWHSLTNAYPFDLLEGSLLPANLPVKMVQISKNHAWVLVITPYQLIGWLPINDIAIVDQAFIHAWENNHYVAFITDQLPVLDNEQHFLFFSRSGSIAPYVAENAQHYQIHVAYAGVNHHAVLKQVTLAKSDAVVFPMPLSIKRLAQRMNDFLGQPYDWGGHYGYRDCSSTLMDLLAPFAIWLPRGSNDQVHMGEFTSLTQLNAQEKQAFIKAHAIPFLTLLHLASHIALYLGEREGHSVVYQTIWGIPARHWLNGNTERIIGKTVISPLNFNAHFPWQLTNLVERIDGMSVLIPDSFAIFSPVSLSYST